MLFWNFYTLITARVTYVSLTTTCHQSYYCIIWLHSTLPPGPTARAAWKALAGLVFRCLDCFFRTVSIWKVQMDLFNMTFMAQRTIYLMLILEMWNDIVWGLVFLFLTLKQYSYRKFVFQRSYNHWILKLLLLENMSLSLHLFKKSALAYGESDYRI